VFISTSFTIKSLHDGELGLLEKYFNLPKEKKRKTDQVEGHASKIDQVKGSLKNRLTAMYKNSSCSLFQTIKAI